MLKHEKITLDRLRHAFKNRLPKEMYREKVPVAVSAWSVHGEPVPFAVASVQEYQPHAVGQPWGSYWDTTWFRVEPVIPAAWKGQAVHLLFNVGYEGWEGFSAEALIYAGDGRALGAFNGYRNDLRLTEQAAGEERYTFFIEAASNYRDRTSSGPWDPTKAYDGKPQFVLKQAELAVFDRVAWAFYHDFWVAFETAENLPETSPRRGQLIYALNQLLNRYDWEGPGCFACCRELLRPLMERTNSAGAHHISAVGHAHIDTAWLWPLRESIRKCARTFSTALRYMEEYPEYVFVCSQAVHYAWMKAYYPDIYEGIKKAFARGQWEPVGSMWVEPDCNIPCGESLVRQILHGKRFWLQEFGYETRDVWIPDVFGYAASMPQILKLAGVEQFLTQKISWSQFNRFPHHTFLWEGIDGTRIFTHFPPDDTYNAQMKPWDLLNSQNRFLEHGRANRSLLVYGFGDGGGGPTRSMLENARRMKDFEGLPRLTLEKTTAFFQKAKEDAVDLPVWSGELYLELHRATYTTQGRTKRANRKGEQALLAAEFFDAAFFAMAEVEPGSISAQAPDRAVYDVFARPDGEMRRGHAGALDRAWKLLLLNQFHDILPGSSIAWVYQDNQKDGETIQTLARQVIDDAVAPLLRRIRTDGLEKPAVVFNPLSFPRFEMMTAPNGQPLFVETPEAGYAVVDLATAGQLPEGLHPVTVQALEGGYVLDNRLVRVTVDRQGLLTSVYDLVVEREVLKSGQPGNLFQLHPDYPAECDAWDVFIYYKETCQNLTECESLQLLEETPLRVTLRTIRTFGRSRIVQDMVLCAGSQRLDFHTQVDWQERKRFLKVAFPVEILAGKATYEIQYGHVERPTHANTTWDMAKFEVCAQKWVDLSEPDYGVALLNDCKYGHDIWGHTIRLSLLRGSEDPDPVADWGRHEFSYALFPHEGDFRAGGVVEEAAAFNQPLQLYPVEPKEGDLPPTQSWLEVSRSGVLVEAFKVAENGDALIVRLVESWGTRGLCLVKLRWPFREVRRADLLERPWGEPWPLEDGVLRWQARPFEILTLRFELLR